MQFFIRIPNINSTNIPIIMKKYSFATITGIIILSLCLLTLFPVYAQKVKDPGILSQDQLNKITELIKPVRDQIEKQLNDDRSGNYKAYREDLKKLAASIKTDEKRDLTNRILKKYSAFFTEVWKNANVDEKSYQQKIRNILPESTASLIQFGTFLNFSIYQPDPAATPPALPPSPKDICIDACTIASGEITGTSALISGNAGQYGNCFLKTSAWGVVAGISSLRGQLKNNCTIPGTFPADSRKLHIRLTYDIKLEASAFSLLGLGSAQAGMQSYQSTESLFVGSPFICGTTKTMIKTINEDYLLDKKDIASSIFKTFAAANGFIISANWSVAEINSIRWTICEEH
jgi:hypothetical protein